MGLISLIFRFILLFIIAYILYSFLMFVFRIAFRAGSPDRKKERPAATHGRKNDDKVIELNRDQYKIE